MKGCYRDEMGLQQRLCCNWSIHLPSHLCHRTYCLCKTPALCKLCLWLSPNIGGLIYISVTDLCLSHGQRITWRVAGSLICIGLWGFFFLADTTLELLSLLTDPVNITMLHWTATGMATVYFRLPPWPSLGSAFAISGGDLTNLQVCQGAPQIELASPVELSIRIRRN